MVRVPGFWGGSGWDWGNFHVPCIVFCFFLNNRIARLGRKYFRGDGALPPSRWVPNVTGNIQRVLRQGWHFWPTSFLSDGEGGARQPFQFDSPVLGTNYLEFEWSVPRTGLQFALKGLYVIYRLPSRSPPIWWPKTVKTIIRFFFSVIHQPSTGSVRTREVRVLLWDHIVPVLLYRSFHL